MKNRIIRLSTLLTSDSLKPFRGRSLFLSMSLSTAFLLGMGVTLGPILAQSGNQSDITGVDLVETGINVIPPVEPQVTEQEILENGVST